MRMRVFSSAFVIGLLLAAVAWAGTTGSISGYVFDENGVAKAGVTVRVVGDLLPAGRTTVTGEDGLYRFPLLQPGIYTVQVVSDTASMAPRK
jgi:hypothetical protein